MASDQLSRKEIDMDCSLTRAGLVLASTAALGLGVVPAAHASDGGSGKQRFVVTFDSNRPDAAPVRATGPIQGTAGGTEHWVDADTLVATMYFAEGSVDVTIDITSGTLEFDPTACRGYSSFEGTWSLDGRSGAYASADGGGSVSQTHRILGTRVNGECQGPEDGVAPRRNAIRAVLTGTVDLG
jgi:hypothetical protein